MKITKTLAVLSVLGASTLLTGCRTAAQSGSLVGAGLGAALGSAIGYHNGNKTAGTLIGGAIGALGGYAVGNEIDKDQRGTHYDGDPRYEPGSRGERYREPERRYEVYEAPPERERVIYRETTIYEDDGCRRCR